MFINKKYFSPLNAKLYLNMKYLQITVLFVLATSCLLFKPFRCCFLYLNFCRKLINLLRLLWTVLLLFVALIGKNSEVILSDALFSRSLIFGHFLSYFEKQLKNNSNTWINWVNSYKTWIGHQHYLWTW